jgi:hypothetical protein
MAGLDDIVASPDGSRLLLYRNSVAEELWSLETFPPKPIAALRDFAGSEREG